MPERKRFFLLMSSLMETYGVTYRVKPGVIYRAKPGVIYRDTLGVTYRGTLRVTYRAKHSVTYRDTFGVTPFHRPIIPFMFTISRAVETSDLLAEPPVIY